MIHCHSFFFFCWMCIFLMFYLASHMYKHLWVWFWPSWLLHEKWAAHRCIVKDECKKKKKKLTAKCEVQCWRLLLSGLMVLYNFNMVFRFHCKRFKTCMVIVCCPLILSCPRIDFVVQHPPFWKTLESPFLYKISLVSEWMPCGEIQAWARIDLWDKSGCWAVQGADLFSHFCLSPFLQTEPSMAYECHNQPSTLSAHKPKTCK